MTENDFLKQVKDFVFNLFKTELPAQVVYHNYNHTIEVVDRAKEIALAENLSEADLEILLLASWFHDTGFTITFEKHEEKSKEIAASFLRKNKLSSEKIRRVLAAIDATKMPQQPTDSIGRILCDADLYHLGMEDYKEKSNLLRLEWLHLGHKKMTDLQWLEESDTFFKKHKFFTNYAFEQLNFQKTNNWLKVQKDLQKIREEIAVKTQKQTLKSADLKRKKAKENRPDRGIETMYRVTLRNHIKLSDIADTKANILLSVSAITLSIALSMLFPKLDKPDNYYLVYPTLLFLFITVLTIIFSILSTRPKVTSGKFTQDDVNNKKVNLLFFGNFHKMPLIKFQEGMTVLMNDREYLYKSLMKDLYFLGVVLDKKYRLLRIAYTIFMLGIILSVLAFVIAFVLMKEVAV